MTFASARIFTPDGNHVTLLAVGPSAESFAAQGFERAKVLDNITVGFTNGDATVTYAGAQAGHVNDILISEETRDAYKIVTATFGVGYELDRVYEGTTASHEVHTYVPGNEGGPHPQVYPRLGVVLGDGGN